MPFRNGVQRDSIYIELVRSLYRTLIPTTIMSFGYVISFGAMYFNSGDRIFFLFSLLGIVSGLFRISVLILGSPEWTRPDMDAIHARGLERTFAISYYQFACLLGLSSVYVFICGPEKFHMLAVCLIVGYGAGVAAGVGLRPRIAIPSMLIAITPTIAVAIVRSDMIYSITAAMITALLAGGCQNILAKHKAASFEIAQRLTFATLARHDALTTLPNRLALREWFDSHVGTYLGAGLLAVHCLDLDNFKQVNDSLGHPTGDALLKAAALRLAGALRSGDIASRLGGG